MSLKQEQLQQREEMIECLQEELVKVRLREAENDALTRDLRSRIHELEEDKKTLREIRPDNSVAHLQEELIAVKLREAEANLSLKDLRQRVSELSNQWQRHLQVRVIKKNIFFKFIHYYFICCMSRIINKNRIHLGKHIARRKNYYSGRIAAMRRKNSKMN